MKKFSKTMTCAEVNAKDMVEFLASVGFQPAKQKFPNFWYISPFRTEKTPSFKVNKKKNTWYDFGDGSGGSLVDFCIRFFNCDVKEVLQIFTANEFPLTIVPQNTQTAPPDEESSIEHFETKQLQSYALMHYFKSRRIAPEVALKYCIEATYHIKGKPFYSIAFKNNSGGFELRNKYFKGSYSPKDITHIPRNTDRLTVFEGFFDFLTYETLLLNLFAPPSDFLILNSVSLLEKAKPIIEKANKVLLFLDNDEAGDEATASALSWTKDIDDHRATYWGYKDLNDWLCMFGTARLKPPVMTEE